MIDPAHDLSITNQAEALNISRGSVYYLPRPVPDADLTIMRRLDRLHLEFPFAGSRMLQGLLVAEGHKIGRRHVKSQRNRARPITWRKYKDQINIETVRKRLWDASKAEKGGYLIGSERDGWLLTQTGLKFCKKQSPPTENWRRLIH